MNLNSVLSHATICLVVVGCGRPGGMSPTYPAKDHDPKLTEYAESLAPIIAVVEDFQERNSRFPNNTDEILAELPNPPIENPSLALWC